jgi:hypothetical protein
MSEGVCVYLILYYIRPISLTLMYSMLLMTERRLEIITFITYLAILLRSVITLKCNARLSS